jgi:hypothetical protein
VLAAAAALLLGIVNDDGPTLTLSVVASVTALILLWAGVVRSSGPPQRDRQG